MKKRVSDVDFVNTYLHADSYESVAERIGLTKGSVFARATRLRNAGVKLPKFSRKTSDVDVAGLNSLIDEIGYADSYSDSIIG